MIAEEVGNLLPVLRVLMDAQLEVLGKGFIELGIVVLVFSDFGKHFEALFHNIFLDNLEDLVLLESLTGNVEGKILRVHNTLDKVKVLRNDLFTVVHDEHTADKQLDVVELALLLKEIEWGALGDEQNRLELQLTCREGPGPKLLNTVCKKQKTGWHKFQLLLENMI